MELYDLCPHLTDLFENGRTSILVRFEPSILDFTSDGEGTVIVENDRQRISFALKGDVSSVRTVVAVLETTIFNPENVKFLYTWNIKDLISYFKYYVPEFVMPPVSIVDLKVIEAFLGIPRNPPKTYIEAVNRARIFAETTRWKAIYKSIHQPLMQKVLPAIETNPLLDTVKREWVHPYYEIEGQANGRLNASGKFKNGYLPHTMGQAVKEVLQPKEGYRFLSADFKSCEIFVLHWLSKDAELARIIESGLDLHSEIYRVVTRDETINPAKRDKSKLMFLPVMYGCGAEGLASQLGLKVEVAKELIHRIRSTFPGAHEWMMAKQEHVKQNLKIEDYFGRRREFPENEAYRARNFVVQAVAATFCQEKLIDLFNAYEGLEANIAFSVHDGYGVTFLQKELKNIHDTTKLVLESESKICPGLKIPVDIKFGIKLSNMKRLN